MANPFEVLLRVGDLAPPLPWQLLDAAGAPVPVNALEDEVRFYMRPAGGGAAVIDGEPCTIVDGPTGQVRYAWELGDSVAAGDYLAQFVLLQADRESSYPYASSLVVRVRERVVPVTVELVVEPPALELEIDRSATVVVKRITNGVEEVVTDQVLWTGPVSPLIADVDAAGLVTARQVGTVELTAHLGGLEGSLDVAIAPAPPIAGLVLWLSSANVDGQKNATLLADQLIATWKNLGVGGIDAIAPEYYRPAFKVPAGETPQLQANGVQTRMTLNASLALMAFFHTTGVYDVILVARRRNAGVFSTPLGSTGSTANKGVYLDFNGTGTPNWILCKGVPGVPIVSHVPALVAVMGAPERWLFRGDGANSKIAKNNFAVFDTVPFASGLGAGNATDDFKVMDLGAVTGTEGGNNFYDGDLFEVLIYNRNLSSLELAQVQDYFALRGL